MQLFLAKIFAKLRAIFNEKLKIFRETQVNFKKLKNTKNLTFE